MRQSRGADPLPQLESSAQAHGATTRCASTADLWITEASAALGIIDGVTTNPSLLAKEPGDFRQNLKKICDIVKGPVSGEVTATDFAGMLQQGHDIAKIDTHMVVKVPLTKDGIRACKALAG